MGSRRDTNVGLAKPSRQRKRNQDRDATSNYRHNSATSLGMGLSGPGPSASYIMNHPPPPIYPNISGATSTHTLNNDSNLLRNFPFNNPGFNPFTMLQNPNMNNNQIATSVIPDPPNYQNLPARVPVLQSDLPTYLASRPLLPTPDTHQLRYHLSPLTNAPSPGQIPNVRQNCPIRPPHYPGMLNTPRFPNHLSLNFPHWDVNSYVPMPHLRPPGPIGIDNPRNNFLVPPPIPPRQPYVEAPLRPPKEKKVQRTPQPQKGRNRSFPILNPILLEPAVHRSRVVNELPPMYPDNLENSTPAHLFGTHIDPYFSQVLQVPQERIALSRSLYGENGLDLSLDEDRE